MLERPTGTVIGGYRVGEIVGRGGMGVVYRATDVLLERLVALKLIAPELAHDPSFRTRFLRELKFVGSIDHPNVIRVHHAGEENGVLFIAMHYVLGTDLRAMIQGDGALPPERAIGIVAQVARALEAAHAHGLVHRDVKPANVLIGDQAGADHVYLSDFGLSKHATSAPGLTRTGHFVGTVDYVAPEQIRGESVDARADIYALGCVLFHALTGQPPFPRENDAAKLWAHMYDSVPSVREINHNVPSRFDEVLRRALHKDAAARFQSARELHEAATEALRPLRETPSEGLIAATKPDTDATMPIEEAPAAGVVPPPSPHVVDSPPSPSPPVPAAGSAPPPQSPPPAGPASPVPGDRQSPRRERRSRRILFALATVGLAVIAAAGVLLAGGGDDASAPVTVPPATKLPVGLAWQLADKLPFRRQYAAATTVDGKVFVFGGMRTKSSTTGTQIYDPASNSWSAGPGLARALNHFAAVKYDGDAVVIGGYFPEGDDPTAHESDRVYALQDDDWDPLPPLRHARAAAAAAVVGDKIVVVGGQANGKLVPQTEVYDGHEWTDAKDIPTPREHLGAASDGRYLYAVGGRQLSNDANSTAFERYDPESNEWTELEPMPEKVGSVGVGYAAGRIVAVGGEDADKPYDDVQGYDIRGRQWDDLPALPTRRHGVAVAALGDSLYAIGGATLAGHVAPTNDVEVLDLSGRTAAPVPKNDVWRGADDPPAAVQYAATAEVGDRIWLIGGLGEDGVATAESLAYDRPIHDWTRATALPGPLHHAAAVDYRGEPVVIGGVFEGGGAASVSDRVYVLRNGEWVPLRRLNHARWAAAAAVVEDKIVVVGGRDGRGLVPETEVYDDGQWTEAKKIPTPREHLGAASDGDYVYAVGGRRLSADANVRALERYNPATNTWTELDPMPRNTGSVGVTYVAGRIVAVGGETSSTTVSNAVQAYDVSREQWSPLPELPEARHGVAVAALGRSLFAIGGAAVPGHFQSTRDANVLEFE